MFHDFVESRDVQVLTDMGGEAVVLLFLKGGVAFDGRNGGCFVLEEVVDDRRVVKETMDVGAYAMVSLKDGLVGVADALVNFITLALMAVELEGHLTRGLFRCHCGMNG